MSCCFEGGDRARLLPRTGCFEMRGRRFKDLSHLTAEVNPRKAIAC
jgi:hypothetical protein